MIVATVQTHVFSLTMVAYNPSKQSCAAHDGYLFLNGWSSSVDESLKSCIYTWYHMVFNVLELS